jgi:hypothetical protein
MAFLFLYFFKKLFLGLKTELIALSLSVECRLTARRWLAAFGRLCMAKPNPPQCSRSTAPIVW